MSKLFCILLLLLTSAVTSATANPPVQAPKPVVIDVRTDQEWQAGHLQGAILIPHDRLPEVIGKNVPDRGTPLILYCRSGRRTGLALEALQKLGYRNIINLKTMENASRELGLPIVR